MEQGSFTRLVTIEKIPASGMDQRFSVPDQAFPGVAERLKVEGVDALEAALHVTRKGPIITVSGSVSATLRRICVYSLEEMVEDVHDTFELEFEQVDEEPDLAGELEIDADSPEPVAGETLDLADIAVQQVSLAMDPFPRKEGAEPVRDMGEQPSLSPFSVLKPLKED